MSEMQKPLLGSEEIAGSRETQEEKRKRLKREYSRRYRKEHPDKFREAQRKYRAGNPGAVSDWKRNDYQKHREERIAASVQHYKSSPTRRAHDRIYQKQHRRRLRNEVLEEYGKICACCGETIHEFLAIDHTNGGGSKHRKSLFGYNVAGRDFYLWLKRQGYPKDGYRVLCHSCNQSRGYYGYCPHEQMQTPIDIFLEK